MELIWIVGFYGLLCIPADQDIAAAALSSQLTAEHKGDSCDCMEYWDCVSRGGQAYSYCGLMESSVCCLLPDRQGENHPITNTCGVKGYDSGALGLAEPSEWPWQVAIVEEPGFFYVCGGSLVDESWVLTAAHCVHSYKNQTMLKLKVRLGEFDVSSEVEALPHEDKEVSSIVVHPDYNATTFYADIALLRLHSPAAQRQNIATICIPQQDSFIEPHSPCFLTGWGGEYSTLLKEIFLPIWDNESCEKSLQQVFGVGYQVANTSLCAGTSGRDACLGDSGNPLVCQEGGRWVQRGLVSYGFSCGVNSKPGVYTRIASFATWLHTTVLSPPGSSEQVAP